ncbi:hypothetical protein C3L33_07601, partial [Rhododendron williamsianum]
MTKGSKDVGEFKRCVPVIMYNRIRPYIQRIANGEDSSLITGHPITEMLCSSGTSAGEPKLMPSIAEDLDRRTFLYNLIMPIINQYVPGLDEGKAMYLYFVKAEMSTPSGLPARAVLTSYYKSKHFKCRSPDPYNDFTSPNQAILCIDSNQSMYCQLLAGHYVIFWEIKAPPFATSTPDTDYATLLQECCVAVEEELDYIYRRCRAHDKSVGPLEIRVVKPGTFHGLMDLCVDQGGSINQYKTPRCIKSDAALELLNSNVEGCFFSPRDPAWKP